MDGNTIEVTHGVGKAAAEIERLEGALREIAERRTWAGVWRIGCECERRLPEIFDIADAALARKEADRG